MSTPETSLTQSMTLPEFIDLAGDKLQVPKALRDAIFEKESGFEHYGRRGGIKTSPKGALGVGQLMVDTARSLGVDPHDPLDNAYGSLRLQKQLYDKYLAATGNEKQAALLTAAAYNAGEGAVEKYKGIPPYAETQDYVRFVAAKLKGASFGEALRESEQSQRRVPEEPVVGQEPGGPANWASYEEAARKAKGLGVIPHEREAKDSPEAQMRAQIKEQVVKEHAEARKSQLGRTGAMIGVPALGATAALDRLAQGLNPVESLLNIAKTEDQRIEDEVERRYQAQRRAETPEMIQARKKFGHLSAATRSIGAPVGRFYGGILKGLGGVVSVAGLTPNRISEYVNTKGQFFEEASSLAPLTEEGKIIERGLPEKAVSALADLGIGIGQLVILKKATGMPMGRLMAIETLLKTSDQPVAERAAAVSESYVLGKVLEQHLSRKVSAALFGGPTAVHSGQSVAHGEMSLEDALLQTGIQAGVGFAMGGKPKSRVPEEPGIETLKTGGEADAISQRKISESDQQKHQGDQRLGTETVPSGGDRAEQGGQVQEGQIAPPGEKHPVTGRRYSSTQVDLPPEAAALQRIAAARIPDSELAADGREDKGHITLKYGGHSEAPTEVQDLLANEPPIIATIGKISIFPAKEGADYDVVKMDIDSPDLHRLNAKIAQGTKATDTHPTYKPHITLAYVKPGEGAKYVGQSNELTGQQVTFDRVTFSGRGGQEVEIPLTGQRAAFQHRDLGLVTTSHDQRGVEKGDVRVIDGNGKPHEIKRVNLRGQGNNLAIPVRIPTPAEPAAREGVPSAGETPLPPPVGEPPAPGSLAQPELSSGRMAQRAVENRSLDAEFERRKSGETGPRAKLYSPEERSALYGATDAPPIELRQTPVTKGVPNEPVDILNLVGSKVSQTAEGAVPNVAPSVQLEMFPDHPDPDVNGRSRAIIQHAENGDLGNLSAAINDAPPEVRAQLQGLTAEIAKEKASGTETTADIRSVEPGSEAGAKVPEPDQGLTSGVPREPSTGGTQEVERFRQAQEEFRSQLVPPENLGPGAASIHEKPPEVKERQFGVKLMSDEQIAQDIKDSLGTSQYYEPIPNNVTAKDAQRLVDERGIPQSMQAIRDENNGLPFHVRSAMGQLVIKRLNKVYKTLKTSSPADAEIVLDQATDMAEWQMDYGTRLGQGVQSFAMWTRLSPEGKLLTFKRAVNKARQRHAGAHGTEVQQILKGMEDAGLPGVKPADTAEATPAIRKALAKRAARAKKAEATGDISIWQEYKDSIARQLFNIVSPKKGNEIPPLQEFTERLLANVEPLLQRPEAVKAKPDPYGDLREVVANFDKYQEAWNEAVEFIRTKYGAKPVAELAAVERRITDLHSAFQTKAFDRVFESAVKQAELNFNEIARAHYADRQRTRDSLINDIQDGLGIKLTPEEAADIASRIEQRMEAQIIIARQQILKSMERNNKTARKVQSITDKIIEAARVGVLNEEKFYDIASEKLGLPKYDKDVAAKIFELAGRVEEAPEGIPQDRAILDLNKFIAQQKGFGAMDLPMGIYYGNILSGYNTHIVNFVDTLLNVVSEVNGLALQNPRAAAGVYGGMLRGFVDGRLDAMLALTEGRMVTEGKWMEAPRMMEIAEFGTKGGVPIQPTGILGRTAKSVAESRPATVLNAYKYVGRLLAASDSIMYRSAKEARASLLAYRIAEAEGLKGDALDVRVHQILALDRESDFLAQANREGFTEREAEARALELRDMVRDKDIDSDAADFAGEATYNHAPHGALGYASEVVGNWSQHYPPLKLFVPFTRIVANVTNRGLNYTPWGLKRAFFGYSNTGHTEVMTPEAKNLMLTRASLGTVGLGLLWGLQAGGALTIHGAGPSDKERCRQMQQGDWRPYTVQIGNEFISYVYTPIGLGLSVIGNMGDSQRYHELEQKDIATRGAYAIARIGSTVFSQSFLSGLSRLFNALSESPQESVTAVKQTLSGTVSALTTPALAKDVYRLFDNKVYESNTLMEDLVRNTPFAAAVLKPQLNAFGEPVRVQRQRFLDVLTSDPEWRFVIEKGLRVPVPSRTSEIEETDPSGTKKKRRIEPAEYYQLLSTTGPMVKQWIQDNQARLSTMAEQDAQEELSQEAGKITKREMERFRRGVKEREYMQGVASPLTTVPAEPALSPQ